jgi:hypothetical protein
MSRPTLSLFAVPLLLIGCASGVPKNAITVDRLSQLERLPKLSARVVEIAISIHEKDTITALPRLTTKVGQPAKAAVEREFFYPTAFDIPVVSTPKVEKGFPVTPSTPTVFELKPLGTRLTVTPRVRGPFIELTGMLTRTDHGSLGRGAGEAFSPVVDSTGRVILTENKVPLPHFTTDEFRIHTVGLPSNEQIIVFDGLELHITCKVVH